METGEKHEDRQEKTAAARAPRLYASEQTLARLRALDPGCAAEILDISGKDTIIVASGEFFAKEKELAQSRWLPRRLLERWRDYEASLGIPEAIRHRMKKNAQTIRALLPDIPPGESIDGILSTVRFDAGCIAIPSDDAPAGLIFLDDDHFDADGKTIARMLARMNSGNAGKAALKNIPSGPGWKLAIIFHEARHLRQIHAARTIPKTSMEHKLLEIDQETDSDATALARVFNRQARGDPGAGDVARAFRAMRAIGGIAGSTSFFFPFGWIISEHATAPGLIVDEQDARRDEDADPGDTVRSIMAINAAAECFMAAWAKRDSGAAVTAIYPYSFMRKPLRFYAAVKAMSGTEALAHPATSSAASDFAAACENYVEGADAEWEKLRARPWFAEAVGDASAMFSRIQPALQRLSESIGRARRFPVQTAG